MVQINSALRPTLLVILCTLLSHSAGPIQGHAIDSSDSSIQDFASHSPEQRRTQPQASNVRWLSAKTASSSETQLDQPPLLKAAPASYSSAKLASASKPETVSISNQQTSLDTSTNSVSSTTRPPETTTQQASRLEATKSNWIEVILTNADKISSNEQREREQILNQVLNADKTFAGDQIESATISEFLPSQAPTDSDEDPLESAVLTTDGANSFPEPTRPAADGTTDEASKDLVESNNVSAAISEDGASKPNVVVTVAAKQALNCEQAYHRCSLRRVCAQALRVYDDECRGLISAWTNQCSARCLRAMIALRSSEEGEDLVNCDCQNNEYCLQNKNRSAICRPEVEKAIQPKSVVSCSTASAICMADQLCSTALDYYYQNCQTLFSQRHCSMRCNNSLAILYRQPKASKLIDCQCDGSEEFPCVRYKTYTERLCLNKHQPPPTHQAEDSLANGAYGSDDFRKTNVAIDSETTADSILVEEDNQATFAAGEDDDAPNQTADQLDGPAQHALAEDNWIPLVSGRFFNNLHQQQIRRTQQYQVNRQRSHKQTADERDDKRSRNGSRARAKSSEVKNRSYVFALVASSAGSTSLSLGQHSLLLVMMFMVRRVVIT